MAGNKEGVYGAENNTVVTYGAQGDADDAMDVDDDERLFTTKKTKCSRLWFTMCLSVAEKLPRLEDVPKLAYLTRGYTTQSGRDAYEEITTRPYVLARILYNQYVACHYENVSDAAVSASCLANSVASDVASAATGATANVAESAYSKNIVAGARHALRHPLANDILPRFIALLSPKELCAAMLECDDDLTPFLAASFFEKCPSVGLWTKRIWPRLMKPCALGTDTLVRLITSGTLPRPTLFPLRYVGLWPDADVVLCALCANKTELEACRRAIISELRGITRAIALAAVYVAEIAFFEAEQEKRGSDGNDEGGGNGISSGGSGSGGGGEYGQNLPYPLIASYDVRAGVFSHHQNLRVAAAHFRPFAVAAVGRLLRPSMSYFYDAFRSYGHRARLTRPLTGAASSASNSMAMRKGCPDCVHRGLVALHAALSENHRSYDDALRYGFHDLLTLFIQRGEHKLAALWICAAEITTAELAQFIARRRVFLSHKDKEFLRYVITRIAAHTTEAEEEARLQPPTKKIKISDE